RCAHREALEPLLAERLASRPREAWVARLAAEGVPAGPVHRVDEALASPQAVAREMVRRVKGPQGGELLLLGCPIKFSSGEAAPTAPPALGQHTDQALRDLCGYDEERLARLRGAGVI
ncbi:MAG: CoA transferase, partial [Candidatus Rokubacteria bacterium]|nr:CoA transferase [Candidatus Rokubacteria bacterium]